MSKPVKMGNPWSRRALIKALILLGLAGLSIGLAELSPLRTYLRPDRFQKIIIEAGLIGPALLGIFCAVGTCLFVPVTFFVLAGAATFGPYSGFACVLPGILAGAVIPYFAARRLGNEFVCSIVGDRLRKYDVLIERNGFLAVLFLRLMFVPFAALNYCAGLTKVRFWDYFFATALGETITSFAIIFFVGQIREIWISGDRSRLFSTNMALSLGLLTAVGIIAKLIQRKYIGRSVPYLTESRLPPTNRCD